MEDGSRPFVGELEREASMVNVWRLRNREGLSTCEMAMERRLRRWACARNQLAQMWRSKTKRITTSRDITAANMMFPS